MAFIYIETHITSGSFGKNNLKGEWGESVKDQKLRIKQNLWLEIRRVWTIRQAQKLSKKKAQKLTLPVYLCMNSGNKESVTL